MRKEAAIGLDIARQVFQVHGADRAGQASLPCSSTNYLEVLTNDTNDYSAQLNLIIAQEQEAISIVQLYSAL